CQQHGHWPQFTF
nr:immunoglobulin light chain junction region [Macaca mulatta]